MIYSLFKKILFILLSIIFLDVHFINSYGSIFLYCYLLNDIRIKTFLIIKIITIFITLIIDAKAFILYNLNDWSIHLIILFIRNHVKLCLYSIFLLWWNTNENFKSTGYYVDLHHLPYQLNRLNPFITSNLI